MNIKAHVVSISVQYGYAYPKKWTGRKVQMYKKMLDSRDFIPKYDGSDIKKLNKQGVLDSFTNYGQRVEQWLDKQIEKE